MLRSFSFCRPSWVTPNSASLRVRRSGLLVLTASAVVLGGCSADFLRFDAPVFDLSDERDRDVRPVASRGNDYAPAEATLVQARRDDYGASPPMAPVRLGRGSLSTVGRAVPQPRIMAAQQRVSQPRRQYADASPLATGALGGASKGSVTVERGDTLYQISRRHGVSVAALRDANNLTGNIIRPGQMLVLPPPGGTSSRQAAPAGSSRPLSSPLTRRPIAQAGGRVVTVAPGDSLYAISRRTGVSVSRLKQINGITDVRRLQPGMQLRLSEGITHVERANTVPKSVVAEANRPTSRTDFGQTSRIKAKPIRTVSIGRDMAPVASQPPARADQPRILNGDDAAAASARSQKRTEMTAVHDAPVKFRWPAKGRVIATFNNSGTGVKNDGINISLPIGTPIHAVDDGTVAYAGSELKGYGGLVLLRHDNGWVSAYAHASAVLVKRGDKVSKGEVIAKAGRSGGVTQPQLHFELRREAKPVDPLSHLVRM